MAVSNNVNLGLLIDQHAVAVPTKEVALPTGRERKMTLVRVLVTLIGSGSVTAPPCSIKPSIMWPELTMIMMIFLVSSAMAQTDTDADPQESTSAAVVAEKSTSEKSDEADESGEAKGTGGHFSGRVSFSGDPVPPRKIQITKDAPHCKTAGGEFKEVEVSADGGLANVVVEVQVKQDDWEWEEPEGGFVLRQNGCQFAPWLLVVPDGANVTVFNDDEVTHNVNTGLWNEMQASGTDPVVKPVSGRQPIRVSCNIHSWMEAWIYPARSPHYALTKADGKFSIKGLAPGKYRANAWHPSLGRKKLRITIVDGETTEENIVFEAK